jgi:FtsP/CotA-like multicopper oxidase with cupredoxin domain
MDKRKLLILVPVLLLALGLGVLAASARPGAQLKWKPLGAATAAKPMTGGMGGAGQPKTAMDMMLNRTTPAKRQAAAKRAAAKRNSNPLSRLSTSQSAASVAALLGVRASAATTFSPQGTPDYFGTTPNYANSPLPDLDASGAVLPGTGMRKFVDSLPGLGVANKNNLGQYLTVAVPDTTTYPGSDYYIIGLVEYSEQLHSDLPPTKLRGYVQLNSSGNPMTAPSYLGPTIVAQRDRPTRVKFINKLPTGAGGDLFIPTDTTAMGAGVGPDGHSPYKQNRATLHLHGGATPWISDGTPHQWTTPAGENTAYPKGVSVVNVPDMPDPGPGALTFFYTNQQSARLMFYHDHAYGLTRLNVYAGEAAGYILQDPVEQKLVKGGQIGTVTVAPGTVPAEQIPLIIQDKTFVPKDPQLLRTDPTWDKTKWGPFGSLWFTHVYMPNQNPNDASGTNAMGRYDYGPLFWPVFLPTHGMNPDGTPGVPNVSLTPEAFMDTPLVNGTAYPFVKVSRKAYRFRILNASNDRMWNLQLYYAKSNTPASVNASGMPTLQTNSGEVPMVPAIPHSNDPAWPKTWPTDGRDGGVPDPASAGPKWIQIGTEGGVLPKPVVIDQQPVNYNYNRRDIVVLNVADKSLFLGPAERADVIVDFSQVPAGSKIIMYNDAPAPVPAYDSRLDYYTGDPDQQDTGGAPTTQPGYGPNTRTIMQFQVEGATAASAFDTAALAAALPAAFKASQPAPIVPQMAYPGSTLTTDTYSKIQSTVLTFTPEGTSTPVGVFMQPKAIQELFEMDYGRMNATLGVELPFTNSGKQTTLPMGFTDPPTEDFLDSVNTTTALIGTAADGTQIWKITHNGVDTHVIHFHLFNVQVINRVGWDGAVRPPDPNELGWKESVRMNPLEDCIVAMRPVSPSLPFKIGDSVRPNDPTMPLGNPTAGWDPLTGNPITVVNSMQNFGWEYVWHCHLLGHEENDMMRPIIFLVAPAAPTVLTAVPSAGPVVTLAWTRNWTIPAATNVLVQRATNSAFTAGVTNYPLVSATATGYVDTGVLADTQYYYRVRAENSNSYSAWTNIAGSKTPAASGAPLAPTNLTAEAASRTSIDVTWVNPAGSSVTTNVVQYSTAGPNGPWTNAASVGPAVQLYTLRGLRIFTTYWIRVNAINAAGSAVSAVRSAKTLR